MMKQAARSRDVVLLPLKEEYEETIASLKSEIGKFWDELERLQAQVGEVTAENETLTAQLAEATRCSPAAAAAAGPSGAGGAADSGTRDHQLQLDLAVKERDSAVQLWQASVKEVERLEAALSAARTDGSDQRWQRYTEQIRSQYARAVSTVTAELARQREEAERSAAALAAAEEAARSAEDGVGQPPSAGDVADLEASLGRLADEAGLRTRQEVDAVREQGNKRLAELAEKLQQKDAEEVEHQQLMERLLRDKKKIESEYERLKEEHDRCRSGEAQCAALQELTERLSRLEDARIQAEATAAELTRKLTSAQARHAVELERAAEDAAERQRRLAELSDTCDELIHQKRALTEELAAARTQQDAELAAATERRRELERTVSSLEQKLRQKERLLSVEIHSFETDHEHTKVELRQQLTEQQQMSAKWRRELLSVTEQTERRVADMRRVERDLARRITELEDELREVSGHRLEAEEDAKRYKYRVRELELRVQTAEKRFLTVRSETRRVSPSAAARDPRRHQLED
ncbi:Sodium channel and clathrin linker 1 [Amphibalanus amphitrite]|uniref:Sodium channel and clathrin linker 1 n=1 Tax=Amphibalanus amphitrite TaxID=1232801 RepID=A0A6A4VRT9_AMPAM|nr:Sodium channel and clathrin linker 1 [Amphibalanus amphitrite]